MWWGAAASNIGSYLLTLAVPLLVLETSGSAGQAGLVAGTAAVAKFVSSTPAGVFVDLYPRRVLLLLASALQFLAVISVFAAILPGEAHLGHLITAVVLEGWATPSTRPPNCRSFAGSCRRDNAGPLSHGNSQAKRRHNWPLRPLGACCSPGSPWPRSSPPPSSSSA
ncbi:MFS transporter [Streptomyces sparsogenes]|uniref:MFS transporter n=1 Tax=Streptomyces sparsogenes TaxID=67365 RepID=UPI0033D40431